MASYIAGIVVGFLKNPAESLIMRALELAISTILGLGPIGFIYCIRCWCTGRCNKIVAVFFGLN